MRLSCGILLLLVMMGGGQQQEQEEQEEQGQLEKQGELEDKEEQMNQQLVCSSIKDCAACISAPGCVYCRDPEYTSEERCGIPSHFLSPNSSCSLLEDPQNFIVDVENQTLTSNYSSTGYVQISPQFVRLKLRVGRTEKIQFRVAQALNYPVDLYYLMDLSNSMTDDRDNVVKLGGELAAAIAEITPDYRIGFGSFVDKEDMPYISLVQADNCQTEGGCPPPYSFQHQMRLARNATLFADRVREAPISGNIDNPEGGFDALMQVMVCGERVGWRKEARRVVIYTTDQRFHIAGDGKLGAIVQPNDGLCHLNNTGFYDWSLKQDYPSLGHINHVAKQHSVNLVWAVTGDHFDLYRRLSHMIPSSMAGQISFDSSNVVELVREMYEKITTKIEVEDNSSSSVSVTYTSDCTRRTEKKRTKCRNIPLGTPVTFTAHVTLKECQSPGPHYVSIQPVGLGEKLLLQIEPICHCQCGRLGGEGYEPTSPLCNEQGNSVCGLCECFNRPDTGGSYFGSSCECSGNHTNSLNPESTCRPPTSSSNSPLCSGRGSCKCGKCHCDHGQEESPQISGEFCQCDNTACDRGPSGALCSGRGSCQCGQCRCNPGWTGPACDCKEDLSSCLDPSSGLLCSGHGQCRCGVCQCSDEGYSGATCSECQTCPDNCQSLKECVECLAWEGSKTVESCSQSEGRCEGSEECPPCEEGRRCEESCPHGRRCEESCPHGWQYSEAPVAAIPPHWVNCTHKNDSYCQYSFSYDLETWTNKGPEQVLLHVGEDGNKAVCPVYIKPDYFGIIIGIAGGIVGVGMLTILLWKAFTTVTDRREFARFEAERQMMKWNTNANPIFRQATTTIQNPMYCKDD